MKGPEGRVEISVVFTVCRALGDLSEHAFCLLHISIATLRGRPLFILFLPRCLKAFCGIKWGLGWFRHTKGRLLYFKLHTSNARFAQGQPKKEFHRTTKAIAQNDGLDQFHGVRSHESTLIYVKGVCPPLMHLAARKAAVGVHGTRWP